jgi:hypothetical protein
MTSVRRTDTDESPATLLSDYSREDRERLVTNHSLQNININTTKREQHQSSHMSDAAWRGRSESCIVISRFCLIEELHPSVGFNRGFQSLLRPHWHTQPHPNQTTKNQTPAHRRDASTTVHHRLAALHPPLVHSRRTIRLDTANLFSIPFPETLRMAGEPPVC